MARPAKAPADNVRVRAAQERNRRVVLRAADVIRDGRQVAEVDAFFRGSRPAGAVSMAPWRWSAMVGRDGALAFLLGCEEVHADAERRRHVEAFVRVWSKTAFHREPARFRVVETSERELPFVLAVDADDYSHHTIDRRGCRAFVENYPSPRRLLLGLHGATKKTPLLPLLGVIFDGTPEPPTLRAVTDRRAERTQPLPLVDSVKMATRSGPFRATKAVLDRLIAKGIPKTLAAWLWSGALLDQPDANAAIDSSSCAMPRRARTPPRCGALHASAGGALQGDPRLGQAAAASKLARLPARRKVLPPSGAFGDASRRTLRRLLGLPRGTDRELAEEAQQVRYDGGMRAFHRLLGKLARSVPPRELEPAFFSPRSRKRAACLRPTRMGRRNRPHYSVVDREMSLSMSKVRNWGLARVDKYAEAGTDAFNPSVARRFGRHNSSH